MGRGRRLSFLESGIETSADKEFTSERKGGRVEREREPAGGNKREEDGTDCRQGEEGIKLRFNFAAISQARVARRDTPNIRRNLHFKLGTSCDGSGGRRVLLSAPTLTTKSALRDCEFVRKIMARAITPSTTLQMQEYYL